MTLAQSLTAIIVFWAIIGGLGASLLLPAMQSLIHGNFEGAAQKKTYALVGAAAAIAAAVGPLLGGFVTTYLSWRVGFLLEAVVIAVVLSQVGLLKDVPYTGERQVDAVGAGLSVVGMGGVVLGILVWQEGGDYVVLLIAIGALALWALARWLVRRHREGKVTLLDPDLFALPHFRLGITGQMLQNITLGGAMIALPIFLQIKLEYDALQTGLSLAPLSLTMFAVAILAGRRSGGRRPAKIIRAGFALSTLGLALIIPIVPDADSGWYLPHPAGDRGSGARPAGVAAQQLRARPDRRRADQRGGRRELGGGVVRAFVRPGGGRRRPARDPLAGVHQHDQREPRDPLHAAAADRADAGGRRAGREQHRSSTSCSPTSPRPSATRSSPSTPTRRTSRFRWRCSCRSSRVSSGCSTRSACSAYRTSSPQPPPKRRPWPDPVMSAGQSTAVASSMTRSCGAGSCATPSRVVAKRSSDSPKRFVSPAQCLSSSSMSVV